MLWMFLCLSSVYHCQLLECLMKYKQEVWKVWIGSSCLFGDLSKSTSHWLIDHCVFKGSSVRHIVRPIPSQTSGSSDALPLLAQPQASRCHQWVQRPAVHRWDTPFIPTDQLSSFQWSSSKRGRLCVKVYMLKQIHTKPYAGTYLYCKLFCFFFFFSCCSVTWIWGVIQEMWLTNID